MLTGQSLSLMHHAELPAGGSSIVVCTDLFLVQDPVYCPIRFANYILVAQFGLHNTIILQYAKGGLVHQTISQYGQGSQM